MYGQQLEMWAIGEEQAIGEYVIVRRRMGDFMAYLKGNEAYWGCGKTVYEAVGNLYCAHHDALALRTLVANAHSEMDEG